MTTARQRLVCGIARRGPGQGQRLLSQRFSKYALLALADGSEMLLGLFEQLSEHLERSMQLLVG